MPRMARPDSAVMHAEVRIGDSVIMIGEPMGEFQPMPTSIYIYVNYTDGVYKRALSDGATSVMEPADQFYGDRNAGVKDASGNIWWIATHIEDVSHQEIHKRWEARVKQNR